MKRVTWLLLFLFAWIGIGCNQVFAEESDFCLWFYNDGENNVQFQIYESDRSLQETLEYINFNNLDFFNISESTAMRFSLFNNDVESFENEIRLLLLENGYARIINESIAAQEEINAQKEAQNQHLGGWENYFANNELDAELEDSVWTDLWNNIKSFFSNNYQFIISMIVGCGFIAYVPRKIIKFVHTRRKQVFLGGANASGKTTLRNSMLNPDAPVEDLLHSSPTFKVVRERVIRDDTNHKVSLSASIIDPPGHELSHSIDSLSRLNSKLFVKYVIIIILAPCKGNNEKQAEYDTQYINDQNETLKKLWIPLLQANSTILPEQVILFINKKDLFYNDDKFDLCFKKQEAELGQICRQLGISFNVIKGSILKKVGMTELMRLLRK